MAKIRDSRSFMRVVHRYLGYFLVGIFAVYAISGSVMVYRHDNFMKRKKTYHTTIQKGLGNVEINKIIGVKYLNYSKISHDTAYFKGGFYIPQTGEIRYSKMEYPLILNKLVQIHKAELGNPFSALNLLFGISLFFFVVSSFWMFNPKSRAFKRGMQYVLAGFILALILLFI